MLRIFTLLFVFAFDVAFAQNVLSEKERLEFDIKFFAGHREKMVKNYNEAEREFKLALSINPKSAEVCYQLASTLHVNKKRDEALDYAIRAVKLASENEWYQRFLISSYREIGRLEDAIKQCDLAFKATQSIYFLNQKAEIQLQAREYLGAIKTYDQLTEKLGYNERYTKQKEQLYLILNKPLKAINELEKFLAVYPDNIEIKGMLADLYMGYGQENKAFKLYNEILIVEPKNGYAAFSLADYYKLNNNQDKYLEYVKLGMASDIDPKSKLKMLAILIPSNVFGSNHLQKCDELIDVFLVSNSASPEPYLFKGDLYLQKKDFENARIWYLKATEINPGELVAWDQIIVCDQQLNRFDWMKEDCSKMIELFPQYPTPYIYHGVASKNLGQLNESLVLAKKGVSLATDEESLVSLLSNLGDIAYYSGDFNLCDSAFEAVLALTPENALAMNNYAYFLSLRSKDLDKAENLSKRSLIFDPKNPASLDTYAWILFMKGDYKEAKIQIEKSLEVWPNSAEVVEHYGDILFRLGDKSSALTQWKKAVTLGAKSNALDKKIETGILP